MVTCQVTLLPESTVELCEAVFLLGCEAANSFGGALNRFSGFIHLHFSATPTASFIPAQGVQPWVERPIDSTSAEGAIHGYEAGCWPAIASSGTETQDWVPWAGRNQAFCLNPGFPSFAARPSQLY